MLGSAISIGIGALLAVLAAREMVIAFQTSSFRVRWSRRLIKRKQHPVMFWMNSIALMLACSAGLFLIGWGLQGARVMP
jgi:hypothetical protein